MFLSLGFVRIAFFYVGALMIFFRILAAALLLSMAVVWADEAIVVNKPLQPVPDYLLSPRATVQNFLNARVKLKQNPQDQVALERAIETFDLSAINILVQKEKARDMVWLLSSVFDLGLNIKLKKIPKKPKKDSYRLLKHAGGDIYLLKFEDGRWLFSADSLQRLEVLLAALQQQKKQEAEASNATEAPVLAADYLPLHMRLRMKLPDFWLKPMLTLERWQWLAILLLIMLGSMADRLVSRLLQTLVAIGRRVAKGYYREVPLDMLRPFGLLVMSAIWWMGLNSLGLPDSMFLVLLVAAKFLAVVSSVWSAYRLVDLLSASFKERAAHTPSKVDDMLVPLLTKSIKLFVTVIGIVFIASQMSMDISGLLAGLGLGGLAFALASKDAVENLFGSITILFDRPFIVGDWVVIGKIEGTVEAIGFRSTRIRTFYNSQITLPNSRLITADVDNMGRRRYRRLKCFFNLSYDTSPETIEAFCEGVREIVRLHPHTRKDYFHVYFHGYGESSLDVMVYIFFNTADWGIELRERHRFLLDVLRLSKRLNVEFAYPNRTVHIRRDSSRAETHSNQDLLSQLQQGNSQAAIHIGQQEALSLIQKQQVSS